MKITISQFSVKQFQYFFDGISATLWQHWCVCLHCGAHRCSLPFTLSLFLRWPAIIFFLFATTMGRQKALNDDERAVIKGSAKGTTPDAIAHKIGRHVDTVKGFQKDSSPRKK